MICEHGSLKRSCPYCDVLDLCRELNEKDAENERLRNALIAIITRTDGCAPYTTAGGIRSIAHYALYPKQEVSAE